jgi:hypothetical protein
MALGKSKRLKRGIFCQTKLEPEERGLFTKSPKIM